MYESPNQRRRDKSLTSLSRFEHIIDRLIGDQGTALPSTR